MFTQSPSNPSEACFRFPGHRILCINGPDPTFKALGFLPYEVELYFTVCTKFVGYLGVKIDMDFKYEHIWI